MFAQRECLSSSDPVSDGTIVVTGMGRSGTQFLSTLVNQSQNAFSRHEFIGDTTFASLSYYNPGHPLVATKLSCGFQSFRSQAPAADRYVLVEPGLRYAVPIVKKVAPGSRVVHLVRNGRAVVQSMQRRKYLTSRDPHLPCMPLDPVEFERWEKSDRFGRLCWYWADAVRRLLQLGIRTVHLERLVKDYDYLAAQLLLPLGIDLPQGIWNQNRESRVNRSGFALRFKAWIGRRPHSGEWSASHEQRFRSECGEMMDALNYS